MPDPVLPTTPAASAAPVTPASAPQRDTLDKAMERVQAGQPAPSATPAPQTAAAKRLLKLKLLDDKEEELDLDEVYADETRRGALTADIQKGRNYERAIERERRAAADETVKAQRDAWNAWLKKQNYEVVQDPSSPDGWKLVGKQSTTTADPELDPLTKEEESLKAGLDAGDVSAVRRQAQIDFQRELILRERKQAAAAAMTAAQTKAAQAYQEAKTEVTNEIRKFIAARTKSFDGPDSSRVTDRLLNDAVAAAETAARSGAKWPAVLEAAKAVVFAEADAFDARAAHWRKSLPGAPAETASAPIIGATPSGGGGTTKYKNIDEAYDAVSKQMAARR